MPVARQRHTKARRDRARVHLKLKTKKLINCPQCKNEVEPHKTCPKCGYYKGREVVDTMKRVNKKSQKRS